MAPISLIYFLWLWIFHKQITFLSGFHSTLYIALNNLAPTTSVYEQPNPYCRCAQSVNQFHRNFILEGCSALYVKLGRTSRSQYSPFILRQRSVKFSIMSTPTATNDREDTVTFEHSDERPSLVALCCIIRPIIQASPRSAKIRWRYRIHCATWSWERKHQLSKAVWARSFL